MILSFAKDSIIKILGFAKPTIFLIFFLIVFNVYPVLGIEIRENITNDTYVNQQAPTTNYKTSSTIYLTSYADYYAYGYIELPSNHSNNTLHLYCISSMDGCTSLSLSIYNVSDFDITTITYNNQPTEINLVNNYISSGNTITLQINSTTKYIKIKLTNNDHENELMSFEAAYSVGRPYITYESLIESPDITSYINNYTNDNSSNIKYNNSTTINFSIETNQIIDNYNWYINDNLQSNNFNYLLLDVISKNNYSLKVNVNNINGTSNNLTWNIIYNYPEIYNIYNNYTNDSSLILYINISEIRPINFIINSSRNISLYNWSLDGILIDNNYSNLTFNFNKDYLHNLKINVSYDNDTSNTIELNIYIYKYNYFGLNNFYYYSGNDYNEPKPYFTYNNSYDSINITDWYTGEGGESVNYYYSSKFMQNFTVNTSYNTIFFIHGATDISGFVETITVLYIDDILILDLINDDNEIEISGLNNSIHKLELIIYNTGNLGAGAWFLTGYENAVYMKKIINYNIYTYPTPTPTPTPCQNCSTENVSYWYVYAFFVFIIFYVISFRDRR